MIPNLFEYVNFEEKESQLSLQNKAVTIFNNQNFIMYFPSEGNLLRLIIEFYCFDKIL